MLGWRGTCLLSSLLNIGWESLFQLLAHSSQHSAFVQSAAPSLSPPSVFYPFRMKGEGRAVKSSRADQGAVCNSITYSRCVTLGKVLGLSVSLSAKQAQKECLLQGIIVRAKVINPGCQALTTVLGHESMKSCM